jgi:hypothetical protein
VSTTNINVGGDSGSGGGGGGGSETVTRQTNGNKTHVVNVMPSKHGLCFNSNAHSSVTSHKII